MSASLMSDSLIRMVADVPMEPTAYTPPENLVSGTPDERGALFSSNEAGTVLTGVWTCEAYVENIKSYPFDEMCTVVAGSVTITPEGGAAETFGPGDSFFMRAGFRGLWAPSAGFRKFFMIHAPAA